MLSIFLSLVLGTLVGFMLVGWLSDRTAKNDPRVTPGLSLLPGDVSWQNEKGNVRFYFPITSSIVLSIVASLVMWFINRGL
jgi:hypothetical protein